MQPLRWGIIGPGKIARKFAEAIGHVKGATLQAVASRDIQKAQQFASDFKVTSFYGDYESLAKDTEIDAVYVATPHSFHKEHSILCLNHKKPVLCEKPMSVDVASTRAIIDAARSNNTFLMEAMWTRFMPVILKLKELIDQQVIGDLKYVRADFGFKSEFSASSRLYDLKLGGGSTLDVGVYPLFLVLFLLGKPDEIKSFMQKSATGSDDIMNAILQYKDGFIANILSATNCQTPQTAEIVGSDGTIFIGPAWWKAKSLTITKGDNHEKIKTDYEGNGFEFEIEEVMKCISHGQKESELLPLSFSLLMSEIAGSILAQNGISYQE